MPSILESIIKKKISLWNEIVFTEDVLLKLCTIHNARHYEDEEIKGKGEYTNYDGVWFVVINKNLDRRMKLWVGLHEFGHHLLHYPVPHKFSKGTKRKMDRQANFFAAVAQIPTFLIKENLIIGTTVDAALGMIAEEFNYHKDLIKIRKEIWENYQI